MDVNPFKDMVEKEPLLSFSVYTAGQGRALLASGEEIIDLMKDFEPTHIEAKDFIRAHQLICQWVCMAYETIRTMDEGKKSGCFVYDKAQEIKKMKEKLAIIRMPFAKQELVNHKGYIDSESSVSCFRKGDLGFTIDEKTYWFKDLFLEVKTLFNSIRPEDVQKPFPRK